MVNQLTLANHRAISESRNVSDTYISKIAIGFVIYYGVIVALSLIFGAVGSYVALGLTVVVGLVLILLKFELFVAAYVVFLFTFRYVVYYANLPAQFELVPVVLSFGSAFSLVFARRNIRSGTGAFILIFYGLFFVPWILGAAFTTTALAQLGISFAWRFHGFFFFMAAYLHPKITLEWMRRYLVLAGVILAAQFLVQVLQYFNIPGQLMPPNESYVASGLAANADYFSGTFGLFGGDALGVLELWAIYITLCYGLIKGFSAKLIILTILFFVPTILGDVTFARLGLLAFPMVAMVLWFLGKVTDLARIARSALVLVMIVVPVFLLVLALGEEYAPKISAGGTFMTVSNLLDPDAWVYSLSREYKNETFIYGRQAGRGTALLDAANEMTRADKPQLFIGYGPDSLRVTGSTLFGTTPSRLPTKTILYSFYGFDRLLLETGIVGTVIFLTVLAYPFIKVLQFARSVPLGNLKMLGIMYLAVWFIFVATGQYDGGWFEPYQKVTMFWLVTAGILRVIDSTRSAGPSPDPSVDSLALATNTSGNA